MSSTRGSNPLILSAPEAPKKPRSGWKCLWVTSLVVVGGIGCATSAFFLLLLGLGADIARHPHRPLFHNETVGANRSTLVHPLVNRSQLFDIAVTVWIRGTEEEEKAFQEIQLEASPTKEVSSVNTEPVRIPIPGKGPFQVFRLEDRYFEDKAELYTALYSDVVFRGLRLTDKHILRTVNFTMPTKRFLGANLTSFDLIGTFVLIPSSPSPLEYLHNYTNWIPDIVRSKVVPQRAWPFPLGAPKTGERTLVDKAVDSFGISVPLVSFHEIANPCPSLTETSTQFDAKTEIEDEDEDSPYEIIKSAAPASTSQYKHKHHPHVITRTHIRVLDETALMNRKAYNKAHNTLRLKSCGQSFAEDFTPRRKLCEERNVKDTGIIETRFELRVPDEDGGYHTEYAYNPYMGYFKGAPGPKDNVPVPVKRELCAAAAEASLPEEDFLDVSWKISYSGWTPLNDWLSAFGPTDSPHPVNHNETEYQKAMSQETAELWNGLRGHKFHDDAHPRRRLAMYAIRNISNAVISILVFLYWYTRTTTIGISVPGTCMLLVVQALYAISQIVADIVDGKWIVVILGVGFGFLELYFPLELVARLEFGKTLIPVWVEATHGERASARVDARTRWPVKIGLLLSLLLIFYFTNPHSFQIVAALHPPLSPLDLSPTPYFDWLDKWAGIPLRWTGVLLQIVLNYRSKTFAGSFRTTAWLMFVSWSITVLLCVRWVAGYFEAKNGFGVTDGIDYLLVAVTWWQALKYPIVSQTGTDEFNI